MEPMILGSPMSSPIQSPGSPGASSTYLPSFLLGDTTTVIYNLLLSLKYVQRSTEC